MVIFIFISLVKVIQEILVIEEDNEQIQTLLFKLNSIPEEMTNNESNDQKSEVLRLLSNRSQALNHELRICLFAAAVKSYKCDSLVKPFPQQYIDGQTNEKRFDLLKQDFDCIPALDQLSDRKLPDACWKLLHWVMTCGSIQLIRQPMDSLEVKKLLPDSSKNLRPSLVFQVVSTSKPAFVEAAERLGTFWAFHGSTVESFHSIAHNGLVNCLNKRSLFGSGTYVSSELSVAVEFSPFGFGWHKSSIDKEMSCVALCQVVKHPDIVNSHTTNGVPNAYYVIKNDDLIKVSYILVYPKRKPILEHNQQIRIDSAISSWLYRNRSSLVLTSLLVVLMAIGFRFA